MRHNTHGRFSILLNTSSYQPLIGRSLSRFQLLQEVNNTCITGIYSWHGASQFEKAYIKLEFNIFFPAWSLKGFQKCNPVSYVNPVDWSILHFSSSTSLPVVTHHIKSDQCKSGIGITCVPITKYCNLSLLELIWKSCMGTWRTRGRESLP